MRNDKPNGMISNVLEMILNGSSYGVTYVERHHTDASKVDSDIVGPLFGTHWGPSEPSFGSAFDTQALTPT